MSSPRQIFDDTPLNIMALSSNLWEQGMDLFGSKDFVVLDDLWKSSHLELLRQEILRRDTEFRDARIGKGDQTQRDRRIRSDKILWLIESEPNPIFQKTLVGLQHLQARLSESLRCSFSESEFHLAKYPPGGGYSAHVDQSPNVRPGETQRYLSLVLYLNPEWSDEWGGHLLIYEDPAKNAHPQVIQRIKPQWNRTVLFLSQRVLHEVETSQRERLSLTGWLRK